MRGSQQVLVGDCMEKLAELEAGSVHAVCTSPPYFALRSYLPNDHPDKHKEIGSEPTPEAFVATMVEVFREVRRVLRDDGFVWLNLGDSYDAGGRDGHGTRIGHKQSTNTGTLVATDIPRATEGRPGNQLLMPHRVALALQADGWILRDTVVWAKRSPMPSSQNGVRWERCRVKAKARTWTDDGTHVGDGHSGDVRNTDTQAKWSPCPGCKKCEPNGGYVLRRGQGRTTTAHEYLFLLTKTNDYHWDMENSREPTTGNAHPRGNGVNPKAADGIVGTEKQNASFSAAVNKLVDTRIPRSVWTLSSEPTGSFETVHWGLLAEEGEYSDVEPNGIVGKVSPNCPVHGCPGRANGEHESSTNDHNRHTNDCRDPKLHHAHYEKSSQFDQVTSADSPSATAHNNENHKTAPSPETNPSCTPSEETACHTGDTQALSLSAGPHRDTPESSISLDAMVAHLQDQTQYRTADTFSWPPPDECICSFYQKIAVSAGHFATFPSELVRRCLMPLSPKGCCPECGKQWAPVVESEHVATRPGNDTKVGNASARGNEYYERHSGTIVGNRDPQRHQTQFNVTDYRPTCGCQADKPAPCHVLDPFSGIGTTGQTATFLGHNYTGIELNPVYAAHAEEWITQEPRWALRLQENNGKKTKPTPGQLSLF